jgi:GNAT acetyltransferase-like protein
MKCTLVDFESADWEHLDGFEDRTVFQSREWVRFVAECQDATPVLAELREGEDIVGYFTGLTFSRFGVKVLGSSFPGWTTPYMGFNLMNGISRAEALHALEIAVWDTLKCLHMEVSDPYFSFEDGRNLGFHCDSYPAEKSGVTVEEAHDLAFADEYYEQLKDVFTKQGLVPTYGLDRVKSLVSHLQPTGRILLLRARDPQGRCIGTGIFPGYNKIAEFWGNASFRDSQILRPNESIHWYAMRYWKRRGVEVYDWGGGGTYKEKYGCVAHSVPWFTKSRYQVVSKLRDAAKKAHEQRQRFLGWLQGQRPTRAVDASE